MQLYIHRLYSAVCMAHFDLFLFDVLMPSTRFYIRCHSGRDIHKKQLNVWKGHKCHVHPQPHRDGCRGTNKFTVCRMAARLSKHVQMQTLHLLPDNCLRLSNPAELADFCMQVCSAGDSCMPSYRQMVCLHSHAHHACIMAGD